MPKAKRGTPSVANYPLLFAVPSRLVQAVRAEPRSGLPFLFNTFLTYKKQSVDSIEAVIGQFPYLYSSQILKAFICLKCESYVINFEPVSIV